MTPGGRIRARRKELGWTLDGLAARSGLSKTHLSEVETGKSRLGADALLAIARALSLSLDTIMSGAPGEDHDAPPVLAPALVSYASGADLSFRETVLLASIWRVLAPHRGRDQAPDWRRFHDALRPWMDGP